VPGDGGVVARALKADVPVAETRWDGYPRNRYDFDFRCTTGGLRGYRWLFPCVVDGVPHANVGAYALPPADGVRMQRELATVLAGAGASSSRWKAFPIRTWTPRSVVAAPHVMLAGDAAGCDPLMGEGISFALEYGALAAEAAVDAHRRRRFEMDGYARAVAQGTLGRKLRRLGLGARLFYGRTAGFWFRLASASARAQAIGLAWYNGVGGWDEQSVAQAVWTLVGRRPVT
jgi:flavin-dependent dehydrogenase